MDVNKTVKKINTGISSAKNIISTMSEDEIIELRAELEASKTHFGKWMDSFMVFFAGILAILALKAEWVTVNKNTEQTFGLFCTFILYSDIIARENEDNR